MSGVWEIAVVGGEGFVGNEERHGRPRGDEPAHKCGVRGGDVGRHRGNEPEGEAEPGQEPGPDSGAAAPQDGAAGGQHHPVDADVQRPGQPAFAGEGWLAWALPISVDGMMLAAGRSILRRRRAGIRARFLSWFGFTLGFVASVAANVAAAHPTLVGRLIAAWPPVALFIAYETLAARPQRPHRPPTRKGDAPMG